MSEKYLDILESGKIKKKTSKFSASYFQYFTLCLNEKPKSFSSTSGAQLRILSTIKCIEILSGKRGADYYF